MTVRTFGTTTRALVDLADWLADAGCTHAAMESTGIYWRPVYQILEERMTVLLVNAAHVSKVPGRKTDVKDCEWSRSFWNTAWCAAALFHRRPFASSES